MRRVQPLKASRCCCSRSSSSGGGIDASAGVESIQENKQANYQQYDVTIRKPMGVVLEEVANGTQKNIASVYVAEVVPGSNAEKMGVREGDLLVSCSAVTLKAGKEGAYAKQGHGGRPFDNFQKGVFVSANQTFDITMYVYLAHQLTSAAQGNDTQVTHNHEHTTHETKQGGDRIQ